MKTLLVLALLLSSVISSAQVSSDWKAMKVVRIDVNMYAQDRVFRLPPGKFRNGEQVYVTELRFADGDRLVLDLNEEEYGNLSYRFDSKGLVLDIRGCFKPGEPLVMLCAYENIKIIKN